MSRNRMTSEKLQADTIEAAITALEKSMVAAGEVDDAKIEGLADSVAKEEKKTVSENVESVPKDQGDQNAKANANWKLTEAQRTTVAKRLVTLAKELLV